MLPCNCQVLESDTCCPDLLLSTCDSTVCLAIESLARPAYARNTTAAYSIWQDAALPGAAENLASERAARNVDALATGLSSEKLEWPWLPLLTPLPRGERGSGIRKPSMGTVKATQSRHVVRLRRTTMQVHAASQRARRMLEMDRECGRQSPNPMPPLDVFCEEQNEVEQTTPRTKQG